MRKLKWTVILAFILLLGTVLHYALPRSEVVRIVGVTVQLENLGWNRIFYAATPSGQGDEGVRDVRLIQTMRPGRDVLVLRNEDTGWIWPPYLKFDSSDMQARARDLVSSSEEPEWMAVTYYGLRSELLSIYPNVLQIEPVEGPEVNLVPWTRMIVLILLIVAGAWLWVSLRRRRETADDVSDRAYSEGKPQTRDPAQARFGRFWKRLSGH